MSTPDELTEHFARQLAATAKQFGIPGVSLFEVTPEHIHFPLSYPYAIYVAPTGPNNWLLTLELTMVQSGGVIDALVTPKADPWPLIHLWFNSIAARALPKASLDTRPLVSSVLPTYP